MAKNDLTAAERLIVALDVPTPGDAIGIVERLDNVSFFKIGWQLYLSGGVPDLLRQIAEKRDRKIFIDLKIPGDIGNTFINLVKACVELRVKFLTLSTFFPLGLVEKGKAARSAVGEPKFLTVPVYSSNDASDIAQTDPGQTLEGLIIDRAKQFMDVGGDGIIVSGREIRLCKDAFPQAIIVSPGIRPKWAPIGDHKRFTTPAEAISLGAHYLVVGRPILESPDPRDAAQKIIDEIDAASRSSDGEGSAEPEQARLAV